MKITQNQSLIRNYGKTPKWNDRTKNDTN